MLALDEDVLDRGGDQHAFLWSERANHGVAVSEHGM